MTKNAAPPREVAQTPQVDAGIVGAPDATTGDAGMAGRADGGAGGAGPGGDAGVGHNGLGPDGGIAGPPSQPPSR